MSNYSFTPGTRFSWKDRVYQVRRFISEDIQKVLIEDIISECQLERSIKDLQKAFAQQELSFCRNTRVNRKKETSTIPNPEEQTIALSDYPENLVNTARFRLKAIKELVPLGPGNRNEELVRQIVGKFSDNLSNPDRYKISVRSVYRWIEDYEKSGCDIRSLIPCYQKCGGSGKSRMAPQLINIVDSIINQYSLKREKFTIDDIQAFVAVSINEENNFRELTNQLTLPSRATIARRISSLDVQYRLEARKGKRKANYILKQTQKTEYPQLPLERVEFDHTLTDIIVVDEKDNLPLGRLTLSILIDACTRYPLGYYLGFEPPSYYAVMECLYNSISPKPHIKELFGTEHDWLACGIPNTIVTDQGKDFIGKDLEDACESLGIVLERAPRKSPEFKATVERWFGTLNTGLLHKLPGTTFSNFIERGDYDSTKFACLTLHELDRLLNIFIVDDYAEKFHRGLKGIPARRWEYYLQSNFIPRYPPDQKSLFITLGRVEERIINRYGIEMDYIFYNCDELSTLRQKMNKNEVKVKYHPGDLSRIYVFDPFESKYILVPALDQQYTNNLSLWKHRKIKESAKENGDKMDLVSLGKTKLKIQNQVDLLMQNKKISNRKRAARWNFGGDFKSRSNETDIDLGTNFIIPTPQEAIEYPLSQKETVLDLNSLLAKSISEGYEIVKS